MQQTTETTAATYRERIGKLQAAMKEFGYQAVVLEPGPAMVYLTGVRWGKSERTFAVVLPAQGEPVWVLPGFEEARARELIHVGDDIRVWQEDDSPYERIVQGIKDRAAGAPAGPPRVGIDEAARFFVFDGIRKLAPKLDYTSAATILKQGGVDSTAPAGRGRGGAGRNE
jgi:Xaa-Pro dipeptidase